MSSEQDELSKKPGAQSKKISFRDESGLHNRPSSPSDTKVLDKEVSIETKNIEQPGIAVRNTGYDADADELGLFEERELNTKTDVPTCKYVVVVVVFY